MGNVFLPHYAVAVAPPAEGQLLSVTNTSSIDLTSGSVGVWDDSEGTVIYDNGTSTLGVAWSPDGYAVALDGVIVDRWYLYASGKWNNTSIVFPTLTTPGTTYYIATNGNDGNSGTVYTSPKRSLDAIGSFSAGDTVLLRAGDTWIAGTHFTGDFTPGGSGTSSNRIKFGAYNGADGSEYTDWIENKPVINCNDTVTYGLRLESGNDYIWINNIEFREGDGVGSLGCITTLSSANNFFASHCRVIANGYAGMHLVGAPNTIFHCEFTDNGSHGCKFYQDVTTATGNRYAYNTFSNNGNNAGSTGTELDGVVRLDEAFGNNFGERGNTNHSFYREHNQVEAVDQIGKVRVYNNVFDQRTIATPAALQCMPLKGVGGRAYRNLFMGPMKSAIGFLQASYRGTPRLAESYASCNVISGVDGTFGSDDDFRGAITLDRIDGDLTDGPTSPRNYYRAWAYNNTLYDCLHGINIQPNFWFDTTTESNTGLAVKNNLMSDIQGYASRAMEGGGVHRKPGYFWEHDNNYYWNIPTNAFFVAGEAARNSGVTADSMPFSEWTGGITDWQDSEANPLLDFDADTSMNVASPAFTNAAAEDFSLGTSSPARSENFSGCITEAINLHPLFGEDAALFVGMNNVPMAPIPDMGAYQYLFGKVLDLTKGFVMLEGQATSFVLEAEADTEANLITRTA